MTNDEFQMTNQIRNPNFKGDLFSRFGLGCLGTEQADSGNLSSVNQVPMNSHPNHEEFGARFRRDGEIFGMSNRQRLAVGEVQLESAERSPVAHFLEVRNFHVRDSIVLTDPAEFSICLL